MVSRNLMLKALVLAGPFLLFPFSRSFYVFFVAILAWGLIAARGTSWRQVRAPWLALLAFALPIVWTVLGWTLFKGGPDAGWFSKMGVIFLGSLLALATITLSRDERIHALAGAVISVAVGSWIVDGVLQLATGHSVDCRGELSACFTDDRVSLYFGDRAKLGYYMGLMVFFPACWLIGQRRLGAGILVLLAGGAVALAGGSRFTMLAFLVGALVLALTLVGQMRASLRLRLLLAAGIPLLGLLLGVAFYGLNPAFQARVANTLVGFQGMDHDAWNQALSGRLDIWEPLLAMVRDNWLFGVGPGTLDAGIRPYLGAGNLFADLKIYHAHQVVLDVLAATGLPGLAAFLAFYAWVAREFLRACRAPIDLRWAALLVFLLMWFPLNSPNGFYASDMMLLTFYVLGLGFGFRPAPAAADDPRGAAA